MTREELNRQLDEQERIYYRARLDGDVEKAMTAAGKIEEIKQAKRGMKYEAGQFHEVVSRLERAGWLK